MQQRGVGAAGQARIHWQIFTEIRQFGQTLPLRPYLTGAACRSHRTLLNAGQGGL